MTTVVVMVMSSLTFGYLWLLTSGCSGDKVQATVLVAPGIRDSLSSIARDWDSTEPQVNGQCVGVKVEAKSSAEVATKLGPSWNVRVDGPLPHVWIPESQAWLKMAAISDVGRVMIPDHTPLIATTPTVIAMPQPMAEALGWGPGQDPVDLEPGWGNLAKLADDSSWEDYDHPEWGDIRLGMTNPRESTQGLHALLALIDGDGDGQVSPDELEHTLQLKDSITETEENTDKLVENLLSADNQNESLEYVSAFPALERDVYRYNVKMNPNVPLTAVYPVGGSMDADHPVAVLQDAEWTDSTYQAIGQLFAEYLMSDEGQEVLKDQGYRDGRSRTGGDAINNTDGLTPQIVEPPRAPADPKSVRNTLAAWQALERKTNVLIVIDTSSAMGAVESVSDGQERTRLDIVRDALGGALGMFGDKATVGLWSYSSSYDPSYPDYTELVPLSKFDDDQRDYVTGQLDSLQPDGERGLYDTAVAAYQTLRDNYQEDATNLVLLISAGKNEDPTDGYSLEEAETQLLDMSAASRANPPSIVAIGYGDDVDADALERIASASQGQYFPAKWSDQINTQLLNALFTAT